MNRAHLLLLFSLTLLISFGGGVKASAQSTPAHRAALLVHYGEGRIETHCVRFAEDAITGEELLRRTQLTTRLEYGSLGTSVCMIGTQGCTYPAETCFCKCQTLGADCVFWNYLRQTSEGWRALPTGAATRNIVDGAVFGWSWNAGDGENVSVVLPTVDIEVVCASTAAAPTAPPATAAAPTAPPATAAALPPTSPPPTSIAVFVGIAVMMAGLIAWLRRQQKIS